MSHRYASTILRLLAAVCLAAAGATCWAGDQPVTQKQAEQQLAELQREIEAMQEQLASSRAEHQSGQSQLRDLDLAIQETTRALRALDDQRAEHQRRLDALEREREQERERMRVREDGLARQLAGTYRLARQSRVKLVLNQDDPLQIARLLAYHDHINRSQANRVAELRDALRRLEALYREIDSELEQINELREEQQQNLQKRQIQRGERDSLLTELARRIGGEESRLAELERDRADLESLIERLGDMLADIPPDLGRQVDLQAQKGRLAMPLEARVRHAFGQSRGAGLRWQGWLFDAPAGTEVRSIAHGRVAFADWFRGYGLMVIIDHGQGFMSLYGYNESLLWEVGDWVEAGEVIATAGGSPGGEQGLYFELRRNGKAIDPATWLQR